MPKGTMKKLFQIAKFQVSLDLTFNVNKSFFRTTPQLPQIFNK